MIGVGGLILCRIPKETVDERSEYFKQDEDQMLSVDNDLMKEEHQAMPINKNRQSRVTLAELSERLSSIILICLNLG